MIEEKQTNTLAQKDCVPCKGGTPPLQGDELSTLARQLPEGWYIINRHHLEKEFTFGNFLEALAFTNEVGALAEAQGHHPDIYLAWGSVKLTVWTHKIDGLSESDFILAAKADALR
jgi:4a-hydroxytetrahydrobiopterin dehydratase